MRNCPGMLQRGRQRTDFVVYILSVFCSLEVPVSLDKGKTEDQMDITTDMEGNVFNLGSALSFE